MHHRPCIELWVQKPTMTTEMMKIVAETEQGETEINFGEVNLNPKPGVKMPIAPLDR